MAGAELVLDVGVVLAALVDVVDEERDRRAGGHLAAGIVGEHAGQDAHGVGLAALRGEARLAGPALVQEHLNFLGRQGDAGRAAVDHAADRRPMALAPGGDAKQMAEGVVGHGRYVS